MTQAEKQKYQKLTGKCRFCLVLSVVLVLAAALAKVVYANRSADRGAELEAIKQETAAVRQENLQLKSKISRQSGGLIRLNEEALAQGFTDKPQLKYFNHDGRLALKTH